jgi:SSS family solute:Na+ symporter
VRGSEDFFLAGRKLAWPVIGLSLFATNIGPEHFVGLASAGHSVGLVVGGFEWIASYCLIMLAVVFAPQYLKQRVFTIPEFFEKRFGIETRVALTAYFLVMIVLTKVAVAIFAGSTVISALTGWDLTTIMWTIGITTALYALIGGLTAVVYTDAIQALILIAGSAAITWMALGEVGGWNELTTRLEATNQSNLLSMIRGPKDPGLPFSGFLLGNFLIGGMFYWCMDQVNVQRVLGARDVGQARAGALFAGFLKIIPVFLLVLPGVIAVVLYPGEITNHNETYAVLVRNLLGPGFRGLILAALLAAMMSSLSSSFNSAGTIAARDLFQRFQPRISTTAQIKIGQATVLIVMVAGIAAAPMVGEYETIWDYLQIVSGYLAVPFAVVGLGGIFWRRANRAGALAAVLTGIAAGGFLFLDSTKLQPLITSPYLASFLHRVFVAGIASATALVAVSLLTKLPRTEVLQGTFSIQISPGPDEPPPRSLLHDYRLWAALLFFIVTALWIFFR